MEKFSGIRPLNKHKLPLSSEAVQQLSDISNASLPQNYWDFLEHFGTGIVADWLKVFSPASIISNHCSTQERLKEYFLWDGNVSQAQAIASVMVADSYEGDELYFSPELKKFFVLPRHDEESYILSHNFADCLLWMCYSPEIGNATMPLIYKADGGYDEIFLTSETVGFIDLYEYFKARADYSHVDYHQSDSEYCITFQYPQLGGYVTLAAEVMDDAVYVIHEYATDSRRLVAKRQISQTGQLSLPMVKIVFDISLAPEDALLSEIQQKLEDLGLVSGF